MPAARLHEAPTTSPTTSERLSPPIVLLATDGTPQSDGAAAVCADLQRHHDATLHVLSVVEPMELDRSWYREGMVAGERRASRLAAVRDQVERVGLPPLEIPIVLEQGSPISIIVREARVLGADLLVVGHSPHRTGAFRHETTLRIMRRTRAPLLMAIPSLESLPRHIVAAVDFGVASLRALHAAARLLADDGVLHLAFTLLEQAGRSSRLDDERERAAHHLDRLAATLKVPHQARVEPVVLTGSPFEATKRLVERVGAELVALGTTRHPAEERVTVGRTTSAFARSCDVSILAAPPCNAWESDADVAHSEAFA